ncbi:hypothetical protein, partial [Atlantibacter sp.]|uniref:hypothetical protein n=1 Tax=Atlantibacter sp. TaxID=1903473 RepID=UPI0028A99B6E
SLDLVRPYGAFSMPPAMQLVFYCLKKAPSQYESSGNKPVISRRYSGPVGDVINGSWLSFIVLHLTEQTEASL